MPLQTNSSNDSVFSSARAVIVVILLVIAGTCILFCCAARQKTPPITCVKAYFDKYAIMADDCACDDPVTRDIPMTSKVEMAAFYALQLLIEGPTDDERNQGYHSCIPAGGQIARYEETYSAVIKDYHRRGGKIDAWGKRFLSADGEFTEWGDRVEVKSVKIKDGIAYVDFSKELYSYGGGSCAVTAIITAIKNTAKQFPGVEEAEILIEGREAELEP